MPEPSRRRGRRGLQLVLIAQCALLAAAMLATTLGRPAAAQTAEGFGIRLVEVPADRAEDPRARSYIIDHVAPGTTLERDIEVINGEDTAAEVELYPVDAEIMGDAFVPDPGRGVNELAEWVTVTPEEAVVPPGGRLMATVRIDVPPDATAGERYAVVLAERRPPDAVGAGAVGVAARVGVRLYLSVGGGPEPATDFEITSLTAVTRDDGVRAVRAVVTNTGGRALDFTGDLTLSDGPGGLSAGPYEVARGTTLAPGEEVALDVPLDARIPAGEWQADLRLVSGTLVREVQARLTFTEDAGVGEPQPVTSAGRDPLLPLLLGVAALLLVGVAVWLLSRRWRSSEASAGAGPPAGAGGAPDEVPPGAPPVSPRSAGAWAPPGSRAGPGPATGSAVPPPPAGMGARGPVGVLPPPPPGGPGGTAAPTPPARAAREGPWPPPGGGA